MKRLAVVMLLLSACASAPPPPRYVDGTDGRIFVSDGGTGDALPVVFVHGNGGDHTQWSAQLAHLRRTRRAIAYDLRGMGRSNVSMMGNYSIAAMNDDLHRVVNSLNLGRFVLVGHSYGGAIVATYAAANPDRVAAAVFVDAAGDIKATRDEIDRYLDALRMDKPGTVRSAYAPMLQTASPAVQSAVYTAADRTSTEAYVGAMEGMVDVNIARAAASFKGPMLAIAAIDHPNSFHVQFPNVPVRRMNGVGHWLMMEKPVEFNAILDEFLRTL